KTQSATIIAQFLVADSTAGTEDSNATPAEKQRLLLMAAVVGYHTAWTLNRRCRSRHSTSAVDEEVPMSGRDLGGSFENLTVPRDVRFFYVSDALGAFTFTPPDMWKYPGVANQTGFITPGQAVDIYLFSGCFGLLPLTPLNGGMNTDVVMG